MSEYIITGKWLDSFGIPDMFAEREIVRCRDCKSFNMKQMSGLNERAFWCRHRCSYEREDGYCYMARRKEGGDGR